jgi:hypothetical protein
VFLNGRAVGIRSSVSPSSAGRAKLRLWATMACRYQAGPRLSSRAGWGKRAVLVVSTLLVIALFAVIYANYFS